VKIVIKSLFPGIFYKSVNSKDRHLAVEQHTVLTLDRIVKTIIRLCLMCWFWLVEAFDHGNEKHITDVFIVQNFVVLAKF